MPLPLMMPASVTVLPSTTARVSAPLAKVSVVEMVSAAASQLHSGASNAAFSPASALSLGKGTPMTPVEETNTSLSAQPRCVATCRVMASTASRPRKPVKAFELPALTTSARARPPFRLSRHSSTSLEQQTLRVVTPATLVPSSSVTKVRSQRSHALYCARATRGTAPAMAGMAGKGRARGDISTGLTFGA